MKTTSAGHLSAPRLGTICHDIKIESIEGVRGARGNNRRSWI